MRAVRPSGHRAALGRWALTLGATVASTLMLDAVATAAGVGLAAWNPVGAAPVLPMLAVLAATYLLWAAGMRSNLEANWRLLMETGTSTNSASKLLFDLVRRRSAGPRAERVAATVGYVSAELAKEAPYYAGAFGTTLLSDAVESTDALLFLAGTNIGAAVYEYGVARLTCAGLSNRSRRHAH